MIAALGAQFLLTEYSALIRVMTRKDASMQQTDVLGSPYILREALSVHFSLIVPTI